MTTQLLYIPDGTEFFVGRPAAPVSKGVVDSVKFAVLESGIASEAHFPHVFIPGAMKDPASVLIIRTSTTPEFINRSVDEITERCKPYVLLVLPLGDESNLWPLIRNQNCRLF